MKHDPKDVVKLIAQLARLSDPDRTWDRLARAQGIIVRSLAQLRAIHAEATNGLQECTPEERAKWQFLLEVIETQQRQLSEALLELCVALPQARRH
jgi:hypothetical protein